MRCIVFLNLRRVQNPATSDVPRIAGAGLRAAHQLLQWKRLSCRDLLAQELHAPDGFAAWRDASVSATENRTLKTENFPGMVA